MKKLLLNEELGRIKQIMNLNESDNRQYHGVFKGLDNWEKKQEFDDYSLFDKVVVSNSDPSDPKVGQIYRMFMNPETGERAFIIEFTLDNGQTFLERYHPNELEHYRPEQEKNDDEDNDEYKQPSGFKKMFDRFNKPNNKIDITNL